MYTKCAAPIASNRRRPRWSSIIKPAGRLAFAHQLRGIAALLIVITHYFGTFYGAQGFVSAVTFSSDLQLVAPAWVPYLDFPYLKGPFGVAVFFLISGFVIPFSLEGRRAPQFLLARAFRIYPTYWAALALSMGALYLSSLHWGKQFDHGAGTMLANALLINNLIGVPSIDPINWTLSIEIKFYLVAAVCAPLFMLRGFAGLAALACSGLALVAAAARLNAGMALAMESVYLIFMLAGVLFYQHFNGAFGYLGLLLRSAFLLAVFMLAWSIGPQSGQFPTITVYYLYAYGTFLAAYALRAWFRPMRLLDFLADISYPLYITHSLIGFALLKILMQQGVAFAPAVGLALAVAIGMATALHHLVELPTNGWGKRLAAGLPLRGAAAGTLR
jgi:peptidoglycan/LPS O-acetylase OafA/YrhL